MTYYWTKKRVTIYGHIDSKILYHQAILNFMNKNDENIADEFSNKLLKEFLTYVLL